MGKKNKQNKKPTMENADMPTNNTPKEERQKIIQAAQEKLRNANPFDLALEFFISTLNTHTFENALKETTFQTAIDTLLGNELIGKLKTVNPTSADIQALIQTAQLVKEEKIDLDRNISTFAQQIRQIRNPNQVDALRELAELDEWEYDISDCQKKLAAVLNLTENSQQIINQFVKEEYYSQLSDAAKEALSSIALSKATEVINKLGDKDADKLRQFIAQPTQDTLVALGLDDEDTANELLASTEAVNKLKASAQEKLQLLQITKLSKIENIIADRAKALDDAVARRDKAKDLVERLQTVRDQFSSASGDTTTQESDVTEAQKQLFTAEQRLDAARRAHTEAEERAEQIAQEPEATNQTAEQGDEAAARRRAREERAANIEKARPQVASKIAISKDARHTQANQAKETALAFETQLVSRKNELQEQFIENSSHSEYVKNAARQEMRELNEALKAARQEIRACDKLIAATIPDPNDATQRENAEIALHIAEEARQSAQENYTQASKYTESVQQYAKKVVERFRDTNQGRNPDEYLKSIGSLAKTYASNLEYYAKLGDSTKGKTELTITLSKCKKLQDQLDVYLAHLNKEANQNEADIAKVTKYIDILKNAQTKFAQPLVEIATFCKAEVCDLNDVIDKVNEIISNAEDDGTNPPRLASGSPNISTTEAFKNKARVGTIDFKDERAFRSGEFKAAVVQKVNDHDTCVTEFHINPDDKKRIGKKGSFTAGAKLVEEHMAAFPDAGTPNKPIEIMGDFPKEMIKEMILYCKVKGLSYANMTGVKYTPTEQEKAEAEQKVNDFRKGGAGAEIFGEKARHLVVPEKSIKATETNLETGQNPEPPAPRRVR